MIKSYHASYANAIIFMVFILVFIGGFLFYGRMNIIPTTIFLLLTTFTLYGFLVNRLSDLSFYEDYIVVGNKLSFWADYETIYYRDIAKVQLCFGSREEPYIQLTLKIGRKKKFGLVDANEDKQLEELLCLFEAQGVSTEVRVPRWASDSYRGGLAKRRQK